MRSVCSGKASSDQRQAKICTKALGRVSGNRHCQGGHWSGAEAHSSRQAEPRPVFPQELEQQGSIYTKGCVGQFEKWLQDNLIVVAGVLVGIALLQVRPWLAYPPLS